MDIQTRKKAIRLAKNISNTLALLGASKPIQATTGSVYVTFPQGKKLRISDHYTREKDVVWHMDLKHEHKHSTNVWGCKDFAPLCKAIMEQYNGI